MIKLFTRQRAQRFSKRRATWREKKDQAKRPHTDRSRLSMTHHRTSIHQAQVGQPVSVIQQSIHTGHEEEPRRSRVYSCSTSGMPRRRRTHAELSAKRWCWQQQQQQHGAVTNWL